MLATTTGAEKVSNTVGGHCNVLMNGVETLTLDVAQATTEHFN